MSEKSWIPVLARGQWEVILGIAGNDTRVYLWILPWAFW